MCFTFGLALELPFWGIAHLCKFLQLMKHARMMQKRPQLHVCKCKPVLLIHVLNLLHRNTNAKDDITLYVPRPLTWNIMSEQLLDRFSNFRQPTFVMCQSSSLQMHWRLQCKPGTKPQPWNYNTPTHPITPLQDNFPSILRIRYYSNRYFKSRSILLNASKPSTTNGLLKFLKNYFLFSCQFKCTVFRANISHNFF